MGKAQSGKRTQARKTSSGTYVLTSDPHLAKRSRPDMKGRLGLKAPKNACVRVGPDVIEVFQEKEMAPIAGGCSFKVWSNKLSH